MITWNTIISGGEHINEKNYKELKESSNFTDSLELECIRQRYLGDWAKNFLKTAPKGNLLVKPRRKGNSYYWSVEEKRGSGRSRKQININDNPQMIHALLEKRLQKEIAKRCEGNLKLLENLKNQYQPIDNSAIEDTLPMQHQEIIQTHSSQKVEQWQREPYSKAAFNPDIHIHETDCGLLVRSKSEQLLANALYAYGIPFHYEEELVHQTGIRRRIFPDFTILLPNGERILWEHLGSLSRRDYCENTAEKMHIFQLSGYTIGRNLILTMDDARGDCSSAIINKVIRLQILPHFQ